jgi:cytochrome P450
MDMPTDDLPMLRQLVDDQGAVVSDAISPMSEEERNMRWERMAKAREYLSSIVDARRAAPGEDIVSQMATVNGEDGELVFSNDEILTHLTELLFAGTDTTANLMGQMVIAFDKDPAQLEAVKADPSLWAPACEEGIRFRTPTHGIFRIVTKDVTLSDVTIPAGSLVWLGVSGANRDEARYGCPNHFDVQRTDAGEHLGFGKGRHKCLGAPLTRAEAPIGMAVLYERIPGLRVVAGQELDYERTLVAVLLKHLQVEWGA